MDEKKEQYELIAQPTGLPFNSISEIVDDSIFRGFVRENISELKKNRRKRPEPKAGYYYKRDWYDRMNSEGNVNFVFFIENIESIWLKKSSLSSEVRGIIKFVCDRAFQQTLFKHSQKVSEETTSK